MVARISEAISLGLTDEETSALVGIEPNTLMNWKTDPEFFGAIKSAVAARLVMRLKRIENGVDGWQGSAWLTERLLPNRYAKPEVQISLNAGADASVNHLRLTISFEEAQEIERKSAPIREAAQKLIENHRPTGNGSGRASEPPLDTRR
jgi:hypothetical protein